jgi:hypothetical protein
MKGAATALATVMNWFRQNRFLGMFFVVSGLLTLGAGWFLVSAKSAWTNASVHLGQTAAELDRLERLAPYPSMENLRKMKAHAESYGNAVAKLKDELRQRGTPIVPLAPNEFQSHLRTTVTAIENKARANKVKLPDRFFLGFDEFVGSLPNETAAPLLGEELAQVEWLLNGLLDARIEALTAFHRMPVREERGLAQALPGSPSAAKILERRVVEVTFFSSPSAARRVLNQITGANQPFCIIRLLHVRNERDKGPSREVAADSAGMVPATSSGSTAAKHSTAAPLNFIVGNERIETTAKIEIVRFAF